MHTRTIIQHANCDQNAQCGCGCSGNPWDASWNINPTGWGDNHELGHNMQANRLNEQYATDATKDNWPGYGSRAGENSNDICPYDDHAVYDGHKVKDIPGNDFMLVSLSKLTGMDWRSHFDMLGLRYSSLAADQVQANSTQGSLSMGMYILGKISPSQYE